MVLEDLDGKVLTGRIRSIEPPFNCLVWTLTAETNFSGCKKIKHRVNLNGSLLFCCHNEVFVPRAAAMYWSGIQNTGQVAFERTSSPHLYSCVITALNWPVTLGNHVTCTPGKCT